MKSQHIYNSHPIGQSIPAMFNSLAIILIIGIMLIVCCKAVSANTIDGLSYRQRINTVKGQTPVGKESLAEQAKYGIPVTKQNSSYQDMQQTKSIAKSGHEAKPNRKLKREFLYQLKKHYIHGKVRTQLIYRFDHLTYHGEKKLLRNVKNQSIAQDYLDNLIQQFKERNYKNY